MPGDFVKTVSLSSGTMLVTKDDLLDFKKMTSDLVQLHGSKKFVLKFYVPPYVRHVPMCTSFSLCNLW